jgi:aminopeptidase N
MVPIAIGVVGAKQPSEVILMRDRSMDLDAGKCGELIKLNFGDVGYYRVQYDDATQASLAKSIEAMAPADRVSLLSDTWALVQAGRIAPSRYLEMLSAAAEDDKRAVWQRVIATIDQLDRLERGSSKRPAFQQFARSILQPPFQRIGWNPQLNEPEDNTILRSTLISTLGSLNDPNVIAEAKKSFDSFLKNPASLDVNLRDPVIAIVGRTANRQTYDAIRTLARSSSNAHERSRYYFALANVVDPDLARETLRITLTDELPTVLADFVIFEVAAGEHPELALEFVKANFEVLAAKRGPDFRNFFMSSLMANFTDRAHAAELEHFAPVHETPGGRIAAARAIATILEAADFREHQLVAIDGWISLNGGSMAK